MQQKKRMQLTGSLKYLRNKSVSPIKQRKFILNEDLNEQLESSKSSDIKSTLHLTQLDIEKLINEKYNKIVMSDVQKEIIQQSHQIYGLVGDIDKNRKDLMLDIEIINDDLSNFYQDRKKKGLENVIPGQAIHKLLKAWSEEPTYDNFEIQKYSQELWVSLNKFEKQIQNEERGYKIRYDLQQQRFKSTIEQLKKNSSARIQALESALIECKLKYRRQIDRINMQICEKESVILNQFVEQQAVDDLIKMIDSGIRIKSVQEARTIINQLNKIVKSKQFEIQNLNFQMDAYKKLVDNYEDRILDRELIYLEERKIRQYYQKILMKMARDLNLFKSNKNKLRIFNSLNEMDSDLNYQRQVLVMLKEIEIQESIDSHVNLFLQYQQKEGEINSFVKQTQNIFSNFKDQSEILAENIQNDQESQAIVADQKSDKKQKGLNKDNEYIEILKINIEKLLSIQKQQYQEVEQGIKEYQRKKQSFNIVATKNSGQFNQEFKREYRKEMAFMIQNINQKFLEDFRFEKARILESNAEKAYQKSEESSESFDNQQIVEQNKNNIIKVKQQQPTGNGKYQNFNLIKKQNNLQEVKEPIAAKKIVKLTKKKEKQVDEQHSSGKVSLSSDRSRQKFSEFNNDQDLKVISEESSAVKQKKSKNASQPPLKSIKKSKNKKSVKIQNDEEEDNTLLQKSISGSLSSRSQENIDASNLNSNDEEKNEANNDSKQKKLNQDKKTENIVQKSKVKLAVKNKIINQKSQNFSKKEILQKKNAAQVDEISKQIQQVTQKKNADKDSQKSNDIFNVGVAKVHKQLQTLFQKKYGKMIEEIQPFNEEEFGNKLKMNAFQVTQLQNEIQQAMLIKFNHDTLMRVLYKANILQFFDAFNQKIMETYSLNQCTKVYKNGGIDQDRQNRLNEMTLKEKKNFLSKENDDLQKVQIGNLILPHFSHNGELKGFELRHQLISMMFMNNGFDFNILKRAIKAVCYMNRIVTEGAKEDLVLINQNKVLKKDTQDVEIQVNALELKANRQIKVEQEVTNEDPINEKNEEQVKEEAQLKAETVFINMLKSHLVKVMSRTDFETQKYYKIVIDEMNADELLNYEMEGVFVNQQTMQQDQHISFENYLFSIFNQVRCIVESIPDEFSKKLRINQVLFLNPDYSKAVEKSFANQEVQAVVEKAVKGCLTGNELLTAFFGEKSKLIVRYSQNQLIIDKLMEEEFQKTMKIMDEFAEQIQKLELNAQKKVIKQIKKEQYLLKSANIFEDDHELQQIQIDWQLQELQLQQNQDILNELQDFKLQVQQKMKKIDTSSKFKQYYQNNQKVKTDEKTQVKIQAVQKLNKQFENSFDVIIEPKTIQNQMDLIRTQIQKKKKQDYLDQLKLTNLNLVCPNLTTNVQMKDEITQYSDIVTQVQDDELEDTFQKKEVQQSFYKTDQQFNTVKKGQFQDAELALSKLNQRSPNKYHDNKSLSSKVKKPAQDDKNLQKQKQFNDYLNNKLKNVKEINRYFQIQPEIDQKSKDYENKSKEISFKNVYFGKQLNEKRDETSLKKIFKSELRNFQKDQTFEKIEPQKNNNMSIDEGNHINSMNDSIIDIDGQKFESPQYSVFLLNQNFNDSSQGMQISQTAMRSHNTSKITKYFKNLNPQNNTIQADQFPQINQDKQQKISFNIQQSQDFLNFQNFKNNQSNIQFDKKINLQNYSSNEFSLQQNQLFLNNASPAHSQSLIPQNIIKKAIRTRNQMNINTSQNEGMKTLGEIKLKQQLEHMNEIKQKYINHNSSYIENTQTKVSNDFKYSVSQLNNSSEKVTNNKRESNIRRFNQFLPQNFIMMSPNNLKPLHPNQDTYKELKKGLHSLSLNVNDRSIRQSNQIIQNQKNGIEQKQEECQKVFKRKKLIKNDDMQNSKEKQIVHTIPSIDEKRESQNKLETETYND